MVFKEIYCHIKEFIIKKYNKFAIYIKNALEKKVQINNQISNNNIHVIKATMKSVKIKKKMKTNI